MFRRGAVFRVRVKTYDGTPIYLILHIHIDDSLETTIVDDDNERIRYDWPVVIGYWSEYFIVTYTIR